MVRHSGAIAIRLLLAAACTVAAGTRAADAQAGPSLAETLARVGGRVTEWFSSARAVVADERVSIQRLRADMAPDSPPRYLDFELRLAWDPSTAETGILPEATVVRQLLRVNGRRPRPRDEEGCLDPKAVTPEPLSMFLPDQRAAFNFTERGRATVDGRSAVVIDYRGVARQTPVVTWKDECASIDLPGWTAGRVWIDAATYDVLRLDERLVGQYDFDVPYAQQRRGAPRSLNLERADSSARYRRVEFTDPPESLMLPEEITVLTVIRGAGAHRIRRGYSGYRRFLAEARVLP